MSQILYVSNVKPNVTLFVARSETNFSVKQLRRILNFQVRRSVFRNFPTLIARILNFPARIMLKFQDATFGPKVLVQYKFCDYEQLEYELT